MIDRLVSYSRNDIAFARIQHQKLTAQRLESWIEAACRMANRDLSPIEWLTYLGERPYEQTCPR